jgi:nucleoside-diphosphate-sugar epimerase
MHTKRRRFILGKETKKILVTGSVGQIGSELALELRRRYGAENVVATGRKTQPSDELRNSGPFHFIDVTRIETIEEIVTKYDIDTVYHMAAILSAVGEKNPQLCWHVNMNGTINILELGLKYEMTGIIVPSSIAVWGPGTPLDNTPQETVLKPTTMYGVTMLTSLASTCAAYVILASYPTRHSPAVAQPTMRSRYSMKPLTRASIRVS